MTLGRLLGLITPLAFAARLLRSGFAHGAPDAQLAFLLGAVNDPDLGAAAIFGAVGTILSMTCAWLLGVVVHAGALRLLAAQAGRPEPVPDGAFAEGILNHPESYLVAGAGAQLLKLFAAACTLGTAAAATGVFSQEPGVLSAAMMALAVMLVFLLPPLVAALDVGFARAVILDESPLIALMEGLVLVWERAGSYLPSWSFLLFLEVAIAAVGGVASGIIGALPRERGLWILQWGPDAIVSLAAIAATSLVVLWRLGLNAALVSEFADRLPSPPARDLAPRIPLAVAGGSGETIYQARVVEPASAEIIYPARLVEAAPSVLPEESSAEPGPKKDE
jgi:hypothetical protein